MTNPDLPNFNFTDILVRQIPRSFSTSAIGVEEAEEDVDLVKAREQHNAYIKAFKKAGAKVTVLEGDNDHPDCVFVEDTAVIIGKRALICNPGADSRRGETDKIRIVLEKQFEFEVFEVEHDGKTFLDGGDVIFTGKEIIVGMSERSNAKGAEMVKKTFTDFNVVLINVHGPLHLTTMMHLCGEDTFAVSMESNYSLAMFDQIQEKSQIEYKCVEVHDDKAANCILLNGHLICKSDKENPDSFKALEEATDHKLIGLEMSEIEKAIGSISCMSLRFHRPDSNSILSKRSG